MKLNIVYFSATGTTLKIAKAIAKSFSGELIWHDLAKPQNRQQTLVFSEEDVVLFAFPVYAGRVVRIPRYFFKKITGGGALAINVVTYGNRAYDDALLELNLLSKEAGFNNIATAAFVCEHSFDIGLATGRPDVEDIKKATEFAEKAYSIANQLFSNQALRRQCLEQDIKDIPGQYPFRTQFRHDFGGPLVPSTNENCIDCKKCVKLCPVEAIPMENPFITDAQKCITCVRCIRICPVEARSIDLPDFINHMNWLAEQFKQRKEPEMYFYLPIGV